MLTARDVGICFGDETEGIFLNRLSAGQLLPASYA